MLMEMTQSDIDASAEYQLGFLSCVNCPIAMTLKRYGYTDVIVDGLNITINTKDYVCDLKLQQWIKDIVHIHMYDVQPITFRFTDGHVSMTEKL